MLCRLARHRCQRQSQGIQRHHRRLGILLAHRGQSRVIGRWAELVESTIDASSVPIELDQPLVADPEVMGDLVEHDVPDLAA